MVRDESAVSSAKFTCAKQRHAYRGRMASGSRKRKRSRKVTAPGMRWWGYLLLVLGVLAVGALAVLALRFA